jgi:beta-phosphoglucomutase-like phosphatase (HAD superfamily)
MKEKVILVDCDGVLLDWMYAFKQWMNRHGYKEVNPEVYEVHQVFGIEKKEAKMLVRMFNESATIRKLPPLRDAIKYVRKLHEEHGYVFHAVTSLSNDNYAQHLRTKNLCELFGPTAFEKYVYLDTGADKDEALAVYKDTGCVWVEDKPENARVGKSLGLDAYLMAWEFNADEYNIPRVQNWKEMYERIVG